MLSPLSLLRQAIGFAGRQPVLKHIVLWFVFVPLCAMSIATTAHREGPLNWAVSDDRARAFGIIFLGLCGLVLLFGMVAIFVVGERMLQSRAGRLRSSLRSVITAVQRVYVPMLTTTLLRFLLTSICALPLLFPFVWISARGGITVFPMLSLREQVLFVMVTLLTALPALLFSIGTMLYGVILVHEQVSYWQCLRRSFTVTARRYGSAIITIVTLLIVLFVPIQLILWALNASILPPSTTTAILVSGVGSFLLTIALTLLLLAFVLLYKDLKGGSHHGTFLRKR